MMNIERANAIARLMGTNEAEVKALFEATPEEAVAKLNANGGDITAQEFVEFVDFIKANSAKDGEIGEEELDAVAGGLLPELLFCGGVLLGMYLNKKTK